MSIHKRGWWRRSIALAAAMAVIVAVGLAGTNEKAIRITLGEPSIWSLEQAHYLLESARKRNSSLLGAVPDSLDPNSVNGARFDFLRTMLSVQGEFDQKVGVDNANARAKAPATNAKIAALQRDVDALNKKRDDLTDQLQSATTQDAITVITAKRADIDKQISDKQDELAKLASSKALTAPETGDKPTLISPATTDTIVKLWQDLPPDYRQPKLTASQKLDNHVSFGYELIAKQLTQLRDEVGPGRRVMFLELPQSIDAVPGKAKDHWAQSWWKISGAWYRTSRPMPEHCPVAQLQDIVDAKDLKLAPDGAGRRFSEANVKTVRERDQNRQTNERVEDGPCAETYEWKEISYTSQVRSIELVPAKQSLTLADIHAEVRQLGLSFLGKWLLGFGAKAEYDRTREKFEQFLNQQVYAASFGKGSNVFGWTFQPMPNSDSLENGVRTTYAVLAVPEDVVALEIEGKGCYYNRSKPPAQSYEDRQHDGVNCTPMPASFTLQIPDNAAGFYIKYIDYKPVAPGQPITVVLRGSDISPQIGVLVNGVPLQQVVALGSPNEWRDANVNADGDIKGQFEWVNSQTLAMTFRMPSDFTGTPDIVLVSPAKSYSIHRFRFTKINGEHISECKPAGGYLNDYGCKMFKESPAIASADVIGWDGKKVSIDVQGRGFDVSAGPAPLDHWYVNGKLATEGDHKEQTRTLLSIERPDESPWTLVLVASRGKEQIQSRFRVDDPFAPLITSRDSTALACDKDIRGDPFVSLMEVTGKGQFFNGSQSVALKGADKAAVIAFSFEHTDDFDFSITISHPDPQMVLVFKPSDKKRNPLQVVVDRPNPADCP